MAGKAVGTPFTCHSFWEAWGRSAQAASQAQRTWHLGRQTHTHAQLFVIHTAACVAISTAGCIHPLTRFTASTPGSEPFSGPVFGAFIVSTAAHEGERMRGTALWFSKEGLQPGSQTLRRLHRVQSCRQEGAGRGFVAVQRWIASLARRH